jgi:hypothetical protein
VENGASVASKAIGIVSLIMPMGKVLVLEDCYYVTNSMLDNHDFRTIFNKGVCSIYNINDNDHLCANGCIRHDIYVIPKVRYSPIMHVSDLKRERDNHLNITCL